MNRWRAGKKLGRTLYLDEKCVGILDTPDLAYEVVAKLNAGTWVDMDAARASFNRDVERERQAAAEKCKGYLQQVEALGKRVQELEAERDRLQGLATHLGGEIRGHRQAHQETSADARAVLEACGAQADVDEGRDPIEAARAVRQSLNEWADRASALEKERDQWRTSFRAILRANVVLASQAIGTLDALAPPPADDQEPDPIV